MENTSSIIPLEVWFDILKRLPTKSLSRFRCVSKTWNSLIQSRNFIAFHHAAAAAIGNTHLFVQSFGFGFGFIGGFGKHLLIDLKPLESGLNFLQPSESTIPPSVTILAYANGVLLGSVQLGNEVRHVLCNPTIHRYVVLPEPVSRFCEYRLGLGFVPSKNDIGVVEIIYHVNNGPRCLLPPIVKVCYARERVWKTIAAGLARTYFISNLPDQQCCTNGRVHWLIHCRYENSRYNPWRSEHLLVFDFERERFETLDLPGELVIDPIPSLTGKKLLLFKQNLSVLHFCGPSKFSLWSLTEYSDVSSWAKTWSIDTQMEVVFFRFVVGWRADYDLIVSRDREGTTRVYDRSLGSGEESYVFQFKADVHVSHVCGLTESLFLSDEETQALPLTQMQSIIPN